MKTAEEILKPYVETPFRHTQIVDKDNALLAMKQYADQLRGLKWVPITNQKPPDYERVLFFDSRDKTIHVGYFVWRDTPVDYVTHWMRLPANP